MSGHDEAVLIALYSMTLDTDSGVLVVDRPDGTVGMVDLRSVLDQVGPVDAALGEVRLRLGEGEALGDEEAVLADLESAAGRLDPPDMV